MSEHFRVSPHYYPLTENEIISIEDYMLLARIRGLSNVEWMVERLILTLHQVQHNFNVQKLRAEALQVKVNSLHDQIEKLDSVSTDGFFGSRMNVSNALEATEKMKATGESECPGSHGV